MFQMIKLKVGGLSSSNLTGAKIKPLCWVKQLRFEAFSSVDYLSIIIMSNTIPGN